jgi:hypothetical protein
MGCWHETDFVCNLPIEYNDPIVAFFISHIGKAKDFSGSCYSVDKAFPISLPITAKYDDYGSIKDFDHSDLSIIHMEKVFNKTIDNILEDTQNEELAKVENQINDNFGLVMVHQEIYDTLITRAAIGRENTRKLVDDSLKYLAKCVKDDDEKQIKSKGRFVGLNRSFDRWTITQGIDYDYLAPLEKIIKEKFRIYLARNADLDGILEQIGKQITDRILFNFALSKLRKTWLPQSGKGSQSSEIALHIILANATKKVAIKNKEPNELYWGFLSK